MATVDLTGVPLIHSNGTAEIDLVHAIEVANGAIEAACDALQQTAPNMRDFYPLAHPVESFGKARDDLQADLTAMHNILHRLQYVWTAINAQSEG